MVPLEQNAERGCLADKIIGHTGWFLGTGKSGSQSNRGGRRTDALRSINFQLQSSK